MHLPASQERLFCAILALVTVVWVFVGGVPGAYPVKPAPCSRLALFQITPGTPTACDSSDARGPCSAPCHDIKIWTNTRRSVMSPKQLSAGTRRNCSELTILQLLSCRDNHNPHIDQFVDIACQWGNTISSVARGVLPIPLSNPWLQIVNF